MEIFAGIVALTIHSMCFQLVWFHLYRSYCGLVCVFLRRYHRTTCRLMRSVVYFQPPHHRLHLAHFVLDPHRILWFCCIWACILAAIHRQSAEIAVDWMNRILLMILLTQLNFECSSIFHFVFPLPVDFWTKPNRSMSTRCRSLAQQTRIMIKECFWSQKIEIFQFQQKKADKAWILLDRVYKSRWSQSVYICILRTDRIKDKAKDKTK